MTIAIHGDLTAPAPATHADAPDLVQACTAPAEHGRSIVSSAPVAVGLLEILVLSIGGALLLDGWSLLAVAAVAVVVRALRTPSMRLVPRLFDGVLLAARDLLVVVGAASVAPGDLLDGRGTSVVALLSAVLAARVAGNAVVRGMQRRRPASVLVAGPSVEARPVTRELRRCSSIRVHGTVGRPEDVSGAASDADAIVLTGSMRSRDDLPVFLDRWSDVPVFVTADVPASPGCVETLWTARVQALPVPVTARPSWIVRSWIERAAAGALLVVLLPLLAVIAAGVRLSSPGPVLFRQERVGHGGRRFTLLKFRSMPVSHREAGWNAASRAQPTPFGRFLRDASLDELPQLLNIVRGEMSFVGPRPEMPHYVAEFEQRIDGYRVRHRVPVGLTGWAQANGLRGDTSLADRVRFDNNYIDDWSLGRDLEVLVRTVRQVLPARWRPVPAPEVDRDVVIDLRDPAAGGPPPLPTRSSPVPSAG